MTTRKKYVLSAPASALVAIAAVIWLTTAHAAPSQIITLPNGEQYQFTGVTFSKENVPPSFVARFVHHLPASWAARLQKYTTPYVSQFDAGQKFDQPQLFLWFKWTGNNIPPVGGATSARFTPFAAELLDEAGVVGGVQVNCDFTTNNIWCCVSFPVFPRRSRMIECTFNSRGTKSNLSSNSFGKVRFANPVRSKYPQWQPESIPVAKQTGSLEIRLDQIAVSHDLVGSRPGGVYRLVGKDDLATTFFDVSLKSIGDANETWVVQAAALSDTTGNDLTISQWTFGNDGAGSLSQMTASGAPGLSLPGTLWPDESAWKLKLWVKRNSSFPPADLVTFKNLPVPSIGATNDSFLTNPAARVRLEFENFPLLKATPRSSGSPAPNPVLQVQLPEHPEGVAVDLLSATTSAGDQINVPRNDWVPNGRRFWLGSFPTNATTVDITLVVQKMRSVEFLVKPPQPTNGSNP